jgi:hypothetical protein
MNALQGCQKRTEALAAVAAAQHGVVHRRQVVECGYTAEAIQVRLERGDWAVVGPAVYRMAGAPPTWHQRLMAACLVGGPGVVASHRAAGGLWGFDGVGVGLVEVTVPGMGERRVPGATVHRTRSLLPAGARAGPTRASGRRRWRRC